MLFPDRFRNSKTPTSSKEPAGVLASSIASVLRLPSTQQEDIPSPSADMLMLRIINLCAVSEFVAVLVSLLRLFVIERDGINTELGESVQLRRFGDSIVIRVPPQSQRIEDRIIRVDHSVAIAAFCRLVIFRQRKKAVFLNTRRRRLRLRREVAKESSAV